jgi:Double zinc ribbon
MNDDERDPLDEPQEPAPETTETAGGEASADASTDASADASADAAEAPSAPPPGPPSADAEAYLAPPPPVQAKEATQAHAVPATPLGEGTKCPRCGTENRPGISFCSNCGQRLIAPGAPVAVARPAAPEGTQTCPRCGTLNRSGVPFCGNCGANLRPSAEAAPAEPSTERRRAILGPVVLLIGAIGIVTAWLLPFQFGAGSLWERSFGSAGGYGVAFWQNYSSASGGLQAQAYFGAAAPAPILAALLVLLAAGGVVRARPALLQRIGLTISLVWAIALGALFVAVELIGGPDGDLLDVLRALSPAGIIFLLSGLIVLIGVLTRFSRA